LRQYQKLLADSRYENLVYRLKPTDISEDAPVRQYIPGDYLSFIREVGWGEVGRAGYMLYSQPCYVSEVFDDAPDHLKNIVLFGDDFAGYSGGFDCGKVVEISSADWIIIQSDESFCDFIIEKFDNALF